MSGAQASRGQCASQPGRIANLAFDMYTGSRHIRARGAVARQREGNHGLDAGCAFAKDILKPLPCQPPAPVPYRETAGLSDDISLQIYAGDSDECAARMEEALGSLKEALVADNMTVNDRKQQVLGITKAVRHA